MERICENKRCGKSFTARAADVARGWGRFCSKSCKASEQESRTHQHRNFLRGYTHGRPSRETVNAYEREYGGIACFDNRGEYVGFMDHFSNEDHDCNKAED
jgi:hypothetical protein